MCFHKRYRTGHLGMMSALYIARVLEDCRNEGRSGAGTALRHFRRGAVTARDIRTAIGCMQEDRTGSAPDALIKISQRAEEELANLIPDGERPHEKDGNEKTADIRRE